MNDNTPTPAFPTFEFHKGFAQMMPVGGMTLRDYFAAKAMQGAMSGCAAKDEVILYSELAGLSYETADAMMKAREA